MISAKIICDSVSFVGNRVTTMEVKFHRFLLSEVNTHRVFSRNTSSSRAIPYRKMRQSVIDNPAIPISWPQEQKGMQGGDEIEDAIKAENLWLSSRDIVIAFADSLHEQGVHKSVCNRLLEPYQYVTSIITATDFQNFFHQRMSRLAQPEIRWLAEAMFHAYSESIPLVIKEGGWHIPYITQEDWDDVESYREPPMEMSLIRQISAARCARVSYLTHDGKRSIDEDLALFSRLVKASPPHWSPLEHVATPNQWSRSGNFTGWTQLRHYKGDDL